MKRITINLEQQTNPYWDPRPNSIGNKEPQFVYMVTSLINALDPSPRTFLSRKQVEDLIEDENTTINIKPRKK